MNRNVSDLDGPLDELVDAGILFPFDLVSVGYFDFRHQLLRDAIYPSVTIADRRRFHARAAEFGALLEGASEIHASMHYERAGMTEEAFRTALAGAKQAQAVCSHRESYALFQRAIDNMPASLSDAEQVQILMAFALEAGNVDRSLEEASFATRARQLALRIGDRDTAIEALTVLASNARREGAPIAARRAQAQQLHDEVLAAPPTQAN